MSDGKRDIGRKSDDDDRNFPPLDELPEKIDGRYRILRRLGSGTFGTVYECCDETLQLTVAVKMPSERVFDSMGTRRSFLSEARTLASLNHRLIMKVRDYRELSDGKCYAVFEFIDGVPLNERFLHFKDNRKGLLDLLADVADALHVVHSADLVHRDVKPANILVRPDGSPCLVDFGMAIYDDVQRDRALEMAGTPAYMAPEQVNSETRFLDARTDIWALGIILYEALTGKRPFEGRSLRELLDEILQREPRPLRVVDPTIPRPLELLVQSCLRKAADQRLASATDLATELRSLALTVANAKLVVTETRPKPRTRWASDGNLIDIAFLKDVVFETSLIRSFLESDHQFFISANKGLGKTLMLRYKRLRLTEQYTHDQRDQTRPAVRFIPEGRPFLDFMTSELPALAKGHHKFLSSLRNCKRLWSLALRVCTIAGFPEIVNQAVDLESTVSNRQIREWFNRPHAQPTAIFKDMLSLSLRDLNQLLDTCENWLDYLFCRVHAGVFIFIDRVEQGLTSLPREGWINVQAGLLEAAWDVMSANSHVKIFATIREEAYANYQSDVRANYHSATVALRYSVEDLRKLIDKLAEFYESSQGFNEFVDLTEVRNPQSQDVEESFSYLYRHTVGRPRDCVIICSELSKRREEITESVFREIVNDVGSHVIVANVFDEMSTLIDCLANSAERQRFLGLIPCNILTMSDLREICCEFNRLEQANYDDLHSAGEVLHHPFCELYNCGLLGLVRENLYDGVASQYFKQSYDLLGVTGACLPVSPYYLIHPSLQNLIYQQRSGTGYYSYRHITVGHKYPWREYFPLLISIQKSLLAVREPELKDDVRHVLNFFVAEKARSVSQSDPQSMGDVRNAVREVQRNLERIGYDDLYLGLDELISKFLTIRSRPQ